MHIILPQSKGAMKPSKPCALPRCVNKTHNTYCDKHIHLEGSKFRNKKYNSSPWYNMPIWKGNPNKRLGKRGGLREAQLLRHPACQECERQGKVTPATVVDHIIEWKSGKTKKERWQLFVDPDNHQSLCTSCHNRKTATNK